MWDSTRTLEALERAARVAMGRIDLRERTHAVFRQWDPLESTCRHASLSIL